MEFSLASASKVFAKASLYIISNEEFEKNIVTASEHSPSYRVQL